jgi:aerobic C4-dicarboxylate transport protein
MAGVRLSFLALSATAAALGAYPVAGVALLLGADRIMDSMRVVVNLLGNCVATFVVAKWEGQLDTDRMRKVLDGQTDFADDIDVDGRSDTDAKPDLVKPSADEDTPATRTDAVPTH